MDIEAVDSVVLLSLRREAECSGEDKKVVATEQKRKGKERLGRTRKREREKESERERKRVCVC